MFSASPRHKKSRTLCPADKLIKCVRKDSNRYNFQKLSSIFSFGSRSPGNILFPLISHELVLKDASGDLNLFDQFFIPVPRVVH